MSSGGGGGGGGGGDHHGDYHHQHGHGHGTTDYVFNNHDMESFFFNQPASATVGGGGGGRTGADDELMPPYCSITDYLQGILDPSGLARQLDVPLSAEDAPVKNELSVDASHDSQGTSGVAGDGAAVLTPNSSRSLSCSDREGEGQPSRSKKGRPKQAEDAEVDQKDLEEGENSMKAYVLVNLMILISVFMLSSCLIFHLSSSWCI
jgi:hypothetical protein